jgi:hypothetical protein
MRASCACLITCCAACNSIPFRCLSCPHSCRYFGLNTDVDAVVYLQLVNNLLHDLFPNCITIGEGLYPVT